MLLTIKDKNISLIDKIVSIKDSLPRKQRQLCDYILKNHKGVGILTVKELAEKANVGISTVMRTVKALGYSNFNDLRKDIFDESIPIQSKWTLKKSLADVSQDKEKGTAVIKMWNESVNLLNKSLTKELINNFQKAINLILEAKFINVLGSRPYKSAALYFEQLLGEFYSKIRQLSHDTEVIFDRILLFEKGEVLIVFAFEPYTNRMLDAVKLAHHLGNEIILITDYKSCPVYSYATATLKLEVSKENFSIIPIISLIEALVVEIGRKSSDQSVSRLKKLERTLIEKNVTFSY